MIDARTDAIIRALSNMRDFAPEALLPEVEHVLRKAGFTITRDELRAMLTGTDPNDPIAIQFKICMVGWDAAEPTDWTTNALGTATQPGTPERRMRVLEVLGIPEIAEQILRGIPLDPSQTVVISDQPDDWKPWYTPQLAANHHFYWDAYRQVLERKIGPVPAAELDAVAKRIVSRLADPTRPAPYQSKGLVVGHVQSGKTANFTGVIAKAIDAGYRLVIVLTGTVEILRTQTQRRLDMELIGRQNILGGVDEQDPTQLLEIDYAGVHDRDWDSGKFLVHLGRPRDLGAPDIIRLTGAKFDYHSLAAGLSAMDFRSGKELADPTKPVFDPVNIHDTDVRIAIVKKNRAVLEKLAKDLVKLHTNLAEIPTLIIDDEADQASINTRKQKTSTKDRTAINQEIAGLLGLLKRAQYIGYTATPFANVFVDPNDEQDLFPRDFIVSLEAPKGYMGGRDFHDLNLIDGKATVANSNEQAYVRDLLARPDDAANRGEELMGAIDAFVLSGAIKLWREDQEGFEATFRHHTMLVHEDVKQAEHDKQAKMVLDVWKSGSYSSPSTLRRLAELWESDSRPVCEARNAGAPVPSSFDEIRPYIGSAVDRISSGKAPVIVVNGDKESDYQQEGLDFDTDDVWKILVGGAKLSRGFTIEGLTISYYTRRTNTADALMQMGRWFGYRHGYRDLIRLYVGRKVPGPQGAPVDLYKAFESIVRDEEDFRSELATFQGVDVDGRPRVRPIDVPPMVFQSLPWLKPTAANKMYNAILKYRGAGGRVQDFPNQPKHNDTVNSDHFDAVGGLLDLANTQAKFFNDFGNPYDARYGIADASTVRLVLGKFKWHLDYDFSPTLEFYDRIVAERKLIDWVILLPLATDRGAPLRQISGRNELFAIVQRSRRGDRDDSFSGSDARRRTAMEIITGAIDPTASDTAQAIRDGNVVYPLASQLRQAQRGVMLLNFAADQDGKSDPGSLPDPVEPKDIATVFSLTFPKASAPNGRIGFSVQVKSKPRTAVVRKDEVPGA